MIQRAEKPAAPKLALSILDTAEALGLSDRTVRDMIQAGELPHLHEGTRILVPADMLREWLRQRASEHMGQEHRDGESDPAG